MKGAGGTDGGIEQFFVGLAMMCGGGYLLLQSITVTSNFGFGYRLYSLGGLGGGFGITSGMVMIPFVFGIGMIFYNGKSIIGWLLTCGSLVALIFGVLVSLRFSFRPMSAFDLITILVLSVGGLGMFLRSLKASG